MLLSASAFSSQHVTPASIVYQIEKSTMNDNVDLSYIKSIVDKGMDYIINTKIADALNEKGESRLAQQISNEWSYNFHHTLFGSVRDIGDHKPISQWVSDRYYQVEAILGHDFCVASHIDLMLTFNSSNVVVKPCSFPMDKITDPRIDEYRRHFAGMSIISDSRFEGVIPGASYLVMEIACLAGTSGIGSFVCGLAAGIAEKMMATFVAPQLSDFVFNKACNAKAK